MAAVLRREFDFDLLNGSWGNGEEATLAALDDLLRQRLVGEITAGGAAAHDYSFTHHNIQEVIYTGLYRAGAVGTLPWPGRDGHGSCSAPRAWSGLASWYHFEQARQLTAGLTDEAITYQLMAGRQAERR